MLRSYFRPIALTVTLWSHACMLTAQDLGPSLGPPVDGNGATGEYYGLRLLADGQRMLVAVPLDRLQTDANPLGAESGSVLVLDSNSGTNQVLQRLDSPEVQDNLRFGDAMAVSDQWLAVAGPGYSAELDGAFAGAVWLYRRTAGGWSLRRQISPPNFQNFGNFGQAVVLHGSQLYVGWPGRNSGIVLVFQIGSDDSLTQVAQIQAPTLPSAARAGTALLVHEDVLLIGAPGAGHVGSVPLADFTQPVTWTSGPITMGQSLLAAGTGRVLAGAPSADQTGVLVDLRRGAGSAYAVAGSFTSPQAASGDRFGESLLSDGTRLWVAAPGADSGTVLDAGAVYRTLLASPTFGTPNFANTVSPSGQFGISMALDAKNRLWLGEPLARVGALRPGLVRRYAGIDVPSNGTQLPTLGPGQGAQQDIFGWSVDREGQTAVIGALLRDSLVGADSGEAYVFGRQGSSWTLRQRLQPLVLATDQRFGSAVSISGEHLLVGALWDTVTATEQGSVTSFRLVNGVWQRGARLVASNPQFRANFGTRVIVRGEWAFVSAPNVDGAAGDEGAVYVFRWQDQAWREEVRLQPDEPRPNARFGSALHAEANQLLVGAPGELNNQGAAYLFRRVDEAWQLQERLPAAEAQSFQFGAAVAVQAGEVWIGAPATRRDQEAAFGRVHRYRCAPTCVAQSPLDAPGAPAGWRYGSALSLDQDYAWIAATGATVAGRAGAGQVYRYRRQNESWQLEGSLVSPRPQANAAFGLALSLRSGAGLIAAPFEAGENPAEGRVEPVANTVTGQLFTDGFE